MLVGHRLSVGVAGACGSDAAGVCCRMGVGRFARSRDRQGEEQRKAGKGKSKEKPARGRAKKSRQGEEQRKAERDSKQPILGGHASSSRDLKCQ